LDEDRRDAILSLSIWDIVLQTCVDITSREVWNIFLKHGVLIRRGVIYHML
jgi:hypothetical protein